MTSTSNRHGKAKTYVPESWTTTEEIALCKAWCEAMGNYIVEYKRSGFWEVVFENFKKEMGETIRKYDTVVVKWKILIRPKVVAFSVVYESVQRMDENVSSNLVLFQNAHSSHFYTHTMANEQNKVRDAIISRLRTGQENEYQLINNLLGEINRYMLQNLDRVEEETKVTSLPLDEPLKTFSLQTLLLSSVSDKRIATILEAAREKRRWGKEWGKGQDRSVKGNHCREEIVAEIRRNNSDGFDGDLNGAQFTPINAQVMNKDDEGNNDCLDEGAGGNKKGFNDCGNYDDVSEGSVRKRGSKDEIGNNGECKMNDKKESNGGVWNIKFADIVNANKIDNKQEEISTDLGEMVTYNEAMYHLRIMWNKFGLIDLMKNDGEMKRRYGLKHGRI
nr:hypothetical protein [Tanacetum cinerariifolium]